MVVVLEAEVVVVVVVAVVLEVVVVVVMCCGEEGQPSLCLLPSCPDTYLRDVRHSTAYNFTTKQFYNALHFILLKLYLLRCTVLQVLLLHWGPQCFIWFSLRTVGASCSDSLDWAFTDTLLAEREGTTTGVSEVHFRIKWTEAPE